MKVAAITRFKHGLVWELLKKQGWTQSELAARSGIWAGKLGAIINLKIRPSLEEAQAIQRAFGEAGEFLDLELAWPLEFVGTKTSIVVEQSQEVDPACIAENKTLLLDSGSGDLNELRQQLDLALDTLKPQEAYVIRGRFLESRTSESLRKKLKVCQARVYEIERTALRKLRHPSRIARLAAFGHGRENVEVDTAAMLVKDHKILKLPDPPKPPDLRHLCKPKPKRPSNKVDMRGKHRCISFAKLVREYADEPRVFVQIKDENAQYVWSEDLETWRNTNWFVVRTDYGHSPPVVYVGDVLKTDFRERFIERCRVALDRERKRAFYSPQLYERDLADWQRDQRCAAQLTAEHEIALRKWTARCVELREKDERNKELLESLRNEKEEGREAEA